MKKLSKCKILITGVQGQVGFELTKALSSTGAELILAARRPSELKALGIRTVSVDLANSEDIRSVLREEKPDILINPAAYTAVDKAESSSRDAFMVNEKAVQIMAEEMLKLRGAIIHFSTDYVYNPGHSNPIIEAEQENPVNVYAASKLAGDRSLLSSPVPHIILRTSWVYGVNGNNFVKTMLKLGRDRDSLRIVNDQIGGPTSATTLAQIVSDILIQGKSDPVEFIRSKAGIYNACDEGYTSWFEFAQEIFRVAGELRFELKVKNLEGIPTSAYPTPAKRPLNSRLNLGKLGEVFGIYPPHWKNSLGAFLYQSRPTLHS